MRNMAFYSLSPPHTPAPDPPAILNLGVMDQVNNQFVHSGISLLKRSHTQFLISFYSDPFKRQGPPPIVGSPAQPHASVPLNLQAETLCSVFSTKQSCGTPRRIPRAALIQ
jgi:hypothetical protein